jgi:hypothetical protein
MAYHFLPRGNTVSDMSRETLTVTLPGRNQDFNLLNPEALRVVIRLPGGVEGRQRVRIEESMISRPAALSVVKFTPQYVEFHGPEARVIGHAASGPTCGQDPHRCTAR